MENNGLVSIIMPLFNSENYVSDSIQSVIDQTYQNWELIIVDDCSTDKSVQIVETFNDKRIKLLHNPFNSGAAISRNYALREAKGLWIAFLDSDDQWLPDKLEKQLKFMIENDYSISYTDYKVCKNGKWEKVIRTAPNRLNYRKVINYCYPFTSTMMYNKNKIGLIQIQNLKKNNDYAMWLHVFKNNDGHRIQECLAYYIKHVDSISSGNKIKLIKHHYILFRVELKKSCIVSIALTLNNLWFGFWKKLIYVKRIKEE